MPTDNWTRLGELLVRRRIELDPRYSNRQLFAAERGINYRTVSDVERARRSNYEDGTITAVEVAYSVAPGSVAAVLAGGDLAPVPASRPAGTPPRPAEAPLSRLAAAPPPADAFRPSEEAATLFPGDEVRQRIWDLPIRGADEKQVRDKKLALIRAIDQKFAELRGENHSAEGTA